MERKTKKNEGEKKKMKRKDRGSGWGENGVESKLEWEERGEKKKIKMETT